LNHSQLSERQESWVQIDSQWISTKDVLTFWEISSELSNTPRPLARCLLPSTPLSFPSSPKQTTLSPFIRFRPIYLCNAVYKIITKIIASKLKEILEDNISDEQFGFLKGRQIHQAIGLAQEDFHSIHTKKLKAMAYKVDLSKSFDKVIWLYIRILLILLGIQSQFCYLDSELSQHSLFRPSHQWSYLPFFQAERGLRQGCPLPHSSSLVVVECLSRKIYNASTQGAYKGIAINEQVSLTHLLFVDDILIFCEGSIHSVDQLNSMLALLCKAIGMKINPEKSMLISWRTKH
jgi:hypothetical protein